MRASKQPMAGRMAPLLSVTFPKIAMSEPAPALQTVKNRHEPASEIATRGKRAEVQSHHRSSGAPALNSLSLRCAALAAFLLLSIAEKNSRMGTGERADVLTPHARALQDAERKAEAHENKHKQVEQAMLLGPFTVIIRTCGSWNTQPPGRTKAGEPAPRQAGPQRASHSE